MEKKISKKLMLGQLENGEEVYLEAVILKTPTVYSWLPEEHGKSTLVGSLLIGENAFPIVASSNIIRTYAGYWVGSHLAYNFYTDYENMQIQTTAPIDIDELKKALIAQLA